MKGKAGFLKTTLLDYPGEVAATLFIPGCNLRCPYCHNPDLVEAPFPEDLTPWEEIFSVLEKRKALLGGVCLTGGEPLLHPELPQVVEKIRGMGLKVKLDTNGMQPEKLDSLEVDYIALDLKSSPAGYQLLGYQGTGNPADKIRESLEYIKTSGIPHEIRTTFVPGIVNQEDLGEMLKLLQGTQRYVLNQYRPAKTLDPSYQKIDPYPPSRMEEFRDYFKDAGHIGEVILRGI